MAEGWHPELVDAVARAIYDVEDEVRQRIFEEYRRVAWHGVLENARGFYRRQARAALDAAADHRARHE